MSYGEHDYNPDESILELRAEVLRTVASLDERRRGESDRLVVGRSASSDVVAGEERETVEGTLKELVESHRSNVAGEFRFHVDGKLTVNCKSETFLVGGSMTETYLGPTMMLAGMSDDMVIGAGARVTGPTDITIAGLLGMEQKIGTAVADGTLTEMSVMAVEREFGPGVHACGSAVFSGTVYQSMAAGFMPLMRTWVNIRNLTPGAGGGGGGGGSAPGAPAGPAAAPPVQGAMVAAQGAAGTQRADFTAVIRLADAGEDAADSGEDASTARRGNEAQRLSDARNLAEADSEDMVRISVEMGGGGADAGSSTGRILVQGGDGQVVSVQTTASDWNDADWLSALTADMDEAYAKQQQPREDWYKNVDPPAGYPSLPEPPAESEGVRARLVYERDMSVLVGDTDTAADIQNQINVYDETGTVPPRKGTDESPPPPVPRKQKQKSGPDAGSPQQGNQGNRRKVNFSPVVDTTDPDAPTPGQPEDLWGKFDTERSGNYEWVTREPGVGDETVAQAAALDQIDAARREMAAKVRATLPEDEWSRVDFNDYESMRQAYLEAKVKELEAADGANELDTMQGIHELNSRKRGLINDVDRIDSEYFEGMAKYADNMPGDKPMPSLASEPVVVRRQDGMNLKIDKSYNDLATGALDDASRYLDQVEDGTKSPGSGGYDGTAVSAPGAGELVQGVLPEDGPDIKRLEDKAQRRKANPDRYQDLYRYGKDEHGNPQFGYKNSGLTRTDYYNLQDLRAEQRDKVMFANDALKRVKSDIDAGLDPVARLDAQIASYEAMAKTGFGTPSDEISFAERAEMLRKIRQALVDIADTFENTRGMFSDDIAPSDANWNTLANVPRNVPAETPSPGAAGDAPPLPPKRDGPPAPPPAEQSVAKPRTHKSLSRTGGSSGPPVSPGLSDTAGDVVRYDFAAGTPDAAADLSKLEPDPPPPSALEDVSPSQIPVEEPPGQVDDANALARVEAPDEADGVPPESTSAPEDMDFDDDDFSDLNSWLPAVGDRPPPPPEQSSVPPSSDLYVLVDQDAPPPLPPRDDPDDARQVSGWGRPGTGARPQADEDGAGWTGPAGSPWQAAEDPGPPLDFDQVGRMPWTNAEGTTTEVPVEYLSPLDDWSTTDVADNPNIVTVDGNVRATIQEQEQAEAYTALAELHHRMKEDLVEFGGPRYAGTDMDNYEDLRAALLEAAEEAKTPEERRYLEHYVKARDAERYRLLTGAVENSPNYVHLGDTADETVFRFRNNQVVWGEGTLRQAMVQGELTEIRGYLRNILSGESSKELSKNEDFLRINPQNYQPSMSSRVRSYLMDFLPSGQANDPNHVSRMNDPKFDDKLQYRFDALDDVFSDMSEGRDPMARLDDKIAQYRALQGLQGTPVPEGELTFAERLEILESVQDYIKALAQSLSDHDNLITSVFPSQLMDTPGVVDWRMTQYLDVNSGPSRGAPPPLPPRESAPGLPPRGDPTPALPPRDSAPSLPPRDSAPSLPRSEPAPLPSDEWQKVRSAVPDPAGDPPPALPPKKQGGPGVSATPLPDDAGHLFGGTAGTSSPAAYGDDAALPKGSLVHDTGSDIFADPRTLNIQPRVGPDGRRLLFDQPADQLGTAVTRSGRPHDLDQRHVENAFNGFIRSTEDARGPVDGGKKKKKKKWWKPAEKTPEYYAQQQKNLEMMGLF